MSEKDLAQLKAEMEVRPEELCAGLEDFIRSHVEKLRRDGTILGLSGGVDSAVVAALCARAVGPEKTLALMMPEKDSKKQHVDDALRLAEQLRIEARMIDMTPCLKELGVYKLLVLNKLPLTGRLRAALVRKAFGLYTSYTGKNPFTATQQGYKGGIFRRTMQKGTAYYRAKHRLRMLLLYLNAEIENRLVVGAANKTESSVGFFVKHGCDDASDVMPLLKLYKTQVFQMARHLGIPSGIVDKPPSPDILPGVLDEEAIGLPYAKLDLVLLALEKGWDLRRTAAALDVDERTVEYVRDLTDGSAHMRATYAP